VSRVTDQVFVERPSAIPDQQSLFSSESQVIGQFVTDSVVNALCAVDLSVKNQMLADHKIIACYDGAQYSVRRLTAIECERLMGWEDDWTAFDAEGKPVSITARHEMCGNGVASPVARWIAEQIGRVLSPILSDDDREQALAVDTVSSFAESSFAGWKSSDVSATLKAAGGAMYGGSENLIVAESDCTLSFDSAFGSYAGVFENQSPPLKASQVPPAVTQPKIVAFATNQRSEVRELDDRAVALSAQPATNQQTYVAYLMREREGKAGGGKGLLLSPESSLSLLAANDQRLWIDDEQATVLRKLMPIECERLMGWGDNWTAHGADGEPLADTHRYRMCGNGVASPVARWIAEQVGRVL